VVDEKEETRRRAVETYGFRQSLRPELEAVYDQIVPESSLSPTPAPLPGHGDEPPKTHFAMFIAFLWAVLALGFGLEAVVHFNGWLATGSTQEAGIASIDIIFGLALGALAVSLWLRKDWLPQRVTRAAIAVSTNPTVWVAVALGHELINGIPLTGEM
jgi:uncharacterized membrane protein YciS (DUF1049 family)